MPLEETGTEAVETVVESPEIDLMLSQGIEGPTEAELRGEETAETETEDEETKETKEEETTEEETTEEEETDEETTKEEETKATEEDTANSEPKAEATPKGFVPLAAVHEARGEIKYLKEQLQVVQDQMHDMRTKPAEKDTPELDGFEVLTDEQFEDLAEDNPAQAAVYLRKLGKYEADVRAKADDERRQDDFEKAYDNIIDTSVAAIEKVAPGIFDDKTEVQKELMEFAGDLGFTEDLYYLTNPSTKIILPGESEPLLLGEQAASILGMLVNAKSKTAAPDTKELETKLRTEITAELMKKFKTPDTEEYRGLNQVPKADDETPEENSLHGKVLTTKQLSKLTDAEYEAYLAGN